MLCVNAGQGAESTRIGLDDRRLREMASLYKDYKARLARHALELTTGSLPSKGFHQIEIIEPDGIRIYSSFRMGRPETNLFVEPASLPNREFNLNVGYELRLEHNGDGSLSRRGPLEQISFKADTPQYYWNFVDPAAPVYYINENAEEKAFLEDVFKTTLTAPEPECKLIGPGQAWTLPVSAAIPSTESLSPRGLRYLREAVLAIEEVKQDLIQISTRKQIEATGPLKGPIQRPGWVGSYTDAPAYCTFSFQFDEPTFEGLRHVSKTTYAYPWGGSRADHGNYSLHLWPDKITLADANRKMDISFHPNGSLRMIGKEDSTSKTRFVVSWDENGRITADKWIDSNKDNL